MTKFLIVENYVYDAETTDLHKILGPFLTDEQDELLYSKAVDFDDDGEPCEWTSANPTDEELMDAVDAYFSDEDEALAKISHGAEYVGMDLNNKIRDMTADPEYLAVKEDVKTMMQDAGWTVRRDKNQSVYFRKNDIEVRFSDHELSSDWTGRDQGQWLAADFAWTNETPADVVAALIEGSK